MLVLPTLWVTLWAGWLFVPIWIKQNPPILDALSCWEHLANGTKVVDNLKEYEWFRWLGPTTLSLGTDISQYPDGEQKPDYSLGVIAGLSGPISRLNDPLLPGDDDGLVSVESTKIEGMKDFLVVQSSHAGLRYSKGVAEQVIHFLRTESFYRPETQGNITRLKFEWEYF